MAFIFAILALFVTIVIAGLWSYVEGMTPAPKYTYIPMYIVIVGGSLAIFIASIHYIGW